MQSSLYEVTFVGGVKERSDENVEGLTPCPSIMLTILTLSI